ncbi:hypothetical protein JK364_02355 [Streptomyces sp. 110]|uniref:Integral membrane protein n=1 Tax=Streptomyces endocoffeicus TaxID=2898945 RepID=A0ABS1PFV4_9ACTN|nr:hypothetical protein [Streptomyces endocoffeicus]MBL1111259.1 hypothetical protein [Streptomyces endocoffeicus]
MTRLRQCWFCAGETTATRHDRIVGLHRDVESGPTWYLGVRTTWQSISVRVPRCERCHVGHTIAQSMLAASIAAPIAYAASGELDTLLGILPSTSADKVRSVIWAVVACLPALVWIAARQAWLPWRRLAPRPLSHARGHPAVRRLREDGWRYRPGPFPHWRNAKDPDLDHLSGPSARPRRILGRITGLLGLASLVVTVVLYLRDSELAALFLVIAFGLFFLSSKIDPEV